MNPVLRYIMTAAFLALFYLIYFQAIGPATQWAPWGSQPTPYSNAGPYFLLVIIFFAVAFALGKLIHFDITRDYVKKPKLVVKQ